MSEISQRVLIIDDEDIVHASIKKILSRLGFAVESSFTASKGLELLNSEEFGVVITDLMMPEMNGIEMLQSMREQGITIPSIMITGYPTIKTAMKALRLGATDYIPKPFTREELLGPLYRALRKKEPRDGLSSAEESAQSDDYQIMPGDRFILPEHTWAEYDQDGTLNIGIESGFLSSLFKVSGLSSPSENDLVEQGYPGFKVIAGEETHTVFMPLSGRVQKVNEDLLKYPAGLSHQDWIIKIVPSHLASELRSLQKC